MLFAAFRNNVRNRKMREKMNIRQVKTGADLYLLAYKCARAEEGRKLPGENAGIEVDSDDTTTVPGKNVEGATESAREVGYGCRRIW